VAKLVNVLQEGSLLGNLCGVSAEGNARTKTPVPGVAGVVKSELHVLQLRWQCGRKDEVRREVLRF